MYTYLKFVSCFSLTDLYYNNAVSSENVYVYRTQVTKFCGKIVNMLNSDAHHEPCASVHSLVCMHQLTHHYPYIIFSFRFEEFPFV